MATYDEAHHVVSISDDEVRSGVTGHNVRYVLAFGLTGVILAFAGIAVYFGFDTLHERLTTALALSPFELVRALAAYAVTLLVGAIAVGLLLGVWNMASGTSDDASQTFMRLRVVTQFVLVCLILVLMSHAIV